MSEYFPLHLFHELLFAWYKKNKRDLPWRELRRRGKVPKTRTIRDPYRILVSELMLQQTQVARVILKFYEFIKRWPTIQDLGQANLSDVLIMWKGLGYNRRAKHLLETAKIVVHSHHGIFPTETKDLKNLPGFGPYMVSALRVFAFGEQEAVIDVNVERVLERVENGALKIEKNSKREIEEIARQSIPGGRADEWHQALMDFGATVCTAKSPKCESCPVSRICRANTHAQVNGFASYASWLATQPRVKKLSKKDTGKKFEETDRYFRGRIIDYLRSGQKPMEDVQYYVLTTHNLGDRKRFGNIIESLVIDGLIVIRGNTVSLA